MGAAVLVLAVSDGADITIEVSKSQVTKRCLKFRCPFFLLLIIIGVLSLYSNRLVSPVLCLFQTVYLPTTTMRRTLDVS